MRHAGLCFRCVARAAAAASVVAGVGGCGDRGRVAVSADLKGGYYAATHADHHTFVVDRHGKRARVTLGFADARMTTFGGCNAASGSTYSVRGGKLHLSGTTSVMGVECRYDLVDQDAWLEEFVRDQPTARIKDDDKELVLSTSRDTVTFALEKRQPVIPQAKIDRLESELQRLRTDLDADTQQVRDQVKAGKLTDAQGRARRKQLRAMFQDKNDKATAELLDDE